jgi:septum formation inhibitor-activating ATPase MinD
MTGLLSNIYCVAMFTLLTIRWIQLMRAKAVVQMVIIWCVAVIFTDQRWVSATNRGYRVVLRINR